MRQVWYRDEITGIQAGKQENGKLFFCSGKKGGYTLPDTPQNRIRLERDFINKTGQAIGHGDSRECTYATH